MLQSLQAHEDSVIKTLRDEIAKTENYLDNLKKRLDAAQTHTSQVRIAGSQVIDTGWVREAPLKLCPETHYPVSLEYNPLLGGGVIMRAIFAPKPHDQFSYIAHHGLSKEQYTEKELTLKKEGFRQISHQAVVLSAGATHQAIWMK